jgi:endonuclease/exonuclease/phosphatase family metal-dependent hydrolase
MGGQDAVNKLLRILCMNIHGGRSLDGKRDIKRLHALFEQHDIDIAVLQEMETRSSRRASLNDIEILAGAARPHHLVAFSVGDEAGWYGNLLVSRFAIIRGLRHDLQTARYLEPRNALDALIDTPLGKIRIIGTHLSLSPFERYAEGVNLIRLMDAVEKVEKNPIFLMGDINEWRAGSKLLRYLDSHLTPIPCGATFPSFQPVFKLDRLWCSGLQGEARAQVLTDRKTSFLSDHLPILLEVRALGP